MAARGEARSYVECDLDDLRRVVGIAEFWVYEHGDMPATQELVAFMDRMFRVADVQPTGFYRKWAGKKD